MRPNTEVERHLKEKLLKASNSRRQNCPPICSSGRGSPRSVPVYFWKCRATRRRPIGSGSGLRPFSCSECTIRLSKWQGPRAFLIHNARSAKAVNEGSLLSTFSEDDGEPFFFLRKSLINIQGKRRNITKGFIMIPKSLPKHASQAMHVWASREVILIPSIESRNYQLLPNNLIVMFSSNLTMKNN